jgi:aryl-alcohol dehydrogenase-like predicted oxidoreductase
MSETTDRASVAVPISGPLPVAAPTTAQTATIVDPTPVRRRRLGVTDLEVFPMGLGARAFGDRVDTATATAILDTFRDLGGDLVDTADAYADGRSESILGDWMRTRRNRDGIVVATKVGRGADHPGVRARDITSAVHASLRRLQTDRIDLLHLHVDDPEVEFEETLLAVDELVRAGAVRSFGAARHPGLRLFEARIATAQLGVAPMVSVQARYSLADRRDYEQGMSRIVAAQGLALLPRSPLAAGFLTGRYRRRGDLDRAQRRMAEARLLGRDGQALLAALDRVAAEVDARPGTVALAWLLTRPDVVAPIVTTTTPEDVVDLALAPRLRLTRRQVTELERASAPLIPRR